MIDFNRICDILSELWTGYKNDNRFQDFFEYNDIGLPLAFAISEKIIVPTDTAETYIKETWVLFCESLGLDSDEDYSELDEMFELAEDEEK